MSLGELFANNYDYLNTVALRITRTRDKSLASDLISHTYITIHDKVMNGTVLVPGENDEFVKWFSRCMRNHFNWSTSAFNKERGSKEYLNVDADFGSGHFVGVNGEWRINETIAESIEDDDALKELEIYVEETNDLTKELINISSNLGKEKTLKYVELIEFKLTLEPHEVILFDLYFDKRMSTRQIAKEYSDSQNIINYQSINNMVNVIKQKIKAHKWNH